MERKNVFLKKIVKLCELNNFQEISEETPLELSMIAADHYQGLSDFSYEQGYIIPSDTPEDPSDIVTITSLLATIFLVEERLQTLVDHWGFNSEEYDFVPELLVAVMDVFENRFKQVRNQKVKEQINADENDAE